MTKSSPFFTRIKGIERAHPHLTLRVVLRAEQLAIREKNFEFQIDCLYKRYEILERQGFAHQLTGDLLKGLQLAQHHHLHKQVVRMHQALGRIRYTQASYRDAVFHWTRCIDLCRIKQDSSMMVEAHIGLGQIYYALGDWEVAERFHIDASRLLQNFTDPYLECKQKINVAICALHTNRIDYANELFETAYQLAKREKFLEYEAECIWHLGQVANECKNYKEAREYFEQAIDIARRYGYVWLEGISLNSLGHLQTQIGEIEKAIATFQESLLHAQSTESGAQQIRALGELSRLYELCGHTGLALRYAREQQAIQKHLNAQSQFEKYSEIRSYDLSQKPSVELLLDLSSDPTVQEGLREPALKLITKTALNILRIDWVTVWLINPNGETLRCESTSIQTHFEHDASCDITQVMPLSEDLRKIISHDHVLVLHDVNLHPHSHALSNLIPGHAVNSMLGVSLRQHGKVAGFICFCTIDQTRDWSREDVLFASHVGNLVQQVLSQSELANLLQELEIRVTERTAELSEQTRQLQRAQLHIYQLSEIGREITSSTDMEKVVEVLYHRVAGLIEIDLLAVGILQQESGIIEFPWTISRGTRLLSYSRDIREKDSLAVWCLDHQQAILIENLDRDYHRYINESGLTKIRLRDAYSPGMEPIKPMSLMFVPLQIKNKTVGVLAIHSSKERAFSQMHLDIAQTLAAYTAIAIENGNNTRQLIKAQQILTSQDKLAALGALVAGVAHELNTPIGNSLLTASAMQDQSVMFKEKIASNSLKRSDLNAFSAALDDALELLTRNLSNAGDLVSSFKQVSADQTSQQRRKFNLLQTTQEVARTMHSQIQKHGHHLEIDITDNIVLDNYPGPYGQILNNFINNAMLHAFDDMGQGNMRIQGRLLTDAWVQIIFADDGKGIAASELRRVFDPFYTTKLGQGGSGLGLSIVHNLVCNVMQGKIEVESLIGFGTRFILEIPVKIE